MVLWKDKPNNGKKKKRSKLIKLELIKKQSQYNRHQWNPEDYKDTSQTYIPPNGKTSRKWINFYCIQSTNAKPKTHNEIKSKNLPTLLKKSNTDKRVHTRLKTSVHHRKSSVQWGGRVRNGKILTRYLFDRGLILEYITNSKHSTLRK